jgi:hypothetical protein
MSPVASNTLSPIDRFELHRIARELDDANLPTERLVEMLVELTEMATRYGCNRQLASD